MFFQPKETWTHEFVCLALKGQTRAPLRILPADKFQLQAAGLGRWKICLFSKANFSEFLEKLEEEFPKLRSGVGFVLMRTGHQWNRCLATTTPPAGGYSVPFMIFEGLLRIGPGRSHGLYKTFTT